MTVPSASEASTAEQEIAGVFETFAQAIKNCDGDGVLAVHPPEHHEELVLAYASSAAMEVERNPELQPVFTKTGLSPEVLKLALPSELFSDEKKRDENSKAIWNHVPDKSSMISTVLTVTESEFPIERALTNLTVEGDRATGTIVFTAAGQSTDTKIRFARINNEWKMIAKEIPASMPSHDSTGSRSSAP